MFNFRLILASIFLILISLPMFATKTISTPTQKDFFLAYNNYQTAVEEGDKDKASSYAKQAYLFSEKLKGKDDIQTAMLAYNYAQAFIVSSNRDKDYKALVDIYIHIIDVYEKEYGDEAVDLIDPIMALGNLQLKRLHKYSVARGHYRDALSIAKANSNTSNMLYANLLSEVGKNLSLASGQVKVAKKYLQKSYDIYHQNLNLSDSRSVSSAFWLAKVNLILKRYTTSEKLFLEVLGQYKESEINAHPLIMSANAFLVEVYEKMGESDKATLYCQAIGKSQPWNVNQQQTPIYLTHPVWPRSALLRGKDGWVKISFVVDKAGFVKEPYIKQHQGASAFKKSSMDTVKKWRFAPKFVDGVPVDAETTYTFEYKLN